MIARPTLTSIPKILSEGEFCVTLLGSGTSTGVPEVGCYCATCLSTDPKDHRTRTSLLITTAEGKRILIDCSPDFKEQATRFGIDHLDAIILTHDHYDHIAGLDDLRTIAWNRDINIYALPHVIGAIEHRLYYYFGPKKYTGTPRLILNTISTDPFEIEGLSITPIRVMHGRQEILGYRFGNFAFITDLSAWIPEEDYKIQGVECCMINALRFHKKHPSHQTIEEAISWTKEHKIPESFLIHLSHHCPPHKKLQELLPPEVKASYDGLSIILSPHHSPLSIDTADGIDRGERALEPFTYLDLHSIDYATALALQENYRDKALLAKKEGRRAQNYLLFCEHNPVLTLGKHANENNMLVSETFLKSKGVELFRITRGGDITYHGPGQITGYAILDLELLGWGIKEYIDQIEASIIELLALHGIKGSRIAGATGVWIDPEDPHRARKICAIGVHVSRYVTMHGFALNVNTDLSYFNLINPCGFTDKGVTSMQKELGYEVHMDLIKHQLEGIFRKRLYQAWLKRQDTPKSGLNHWD